MPLLAEPVAKTEVIDLSSDDDDNSVIDLTADDDYSGAYLREDDYYNDDVNDIARGFAEDLRIDQHDESGNSQKEESSAAKIVLPFSFITMEECDTEQGLLLQVGKTVELLPEASLDGTNADFLLIHIILQDVATDEIIIRGTRFRRAHRLNGMLEKKLNEVYMCQTYNQYDERSYHDQSLEDVSLHMVACERLLIQTNHLFPAFNFRNLGLFSCTKPGDVSDTAQLVCRWKYTTITANRKKQKSPKIYEYRLERLSEKEADVEYSASDQALRAAARFPPVEIIDLTPDKAVDRRRDKAVNGYRRAMHEVAKVRSKSGHEGNGKHKSSSYDIIDLDGDDSHISSSDDRHHTMTQVSLDDGDHAMIETVQKTTRHGQNGGVQTRMRNIREETFTIKPSEPTTPPTAMERPDVALTEAYTFGDGFCGAGGISSGARAAGLVLKWAFDIWYDAYMTYRTNFTGGRVFQEDAYTIITTCIEDVMVDVLHLSPPCQKFSPAHTMDGKNDDANEASLFTVGCLVQKVRPRVVTLEETAGLKSHHPAFLHHLIQELTRFGYSVRWKVMVLSDFGVAQPRKRLIIIASCPGEPLPTFPTPTHGPGLEPYTTIADVICHIPRNAANHDPSACVARNKPPYDPHIQLKSAITCSGGQGNLHPSGTRTFTNRELASLQGFPLDHVFYGSKVSVMKQIGNAVPPVFAEKFFSCVVAWMKETDRIEAAGGDSGDLSARKDGKTVNVVKADTKAKEADEEGDWEEWEEWDFGAEAEDAKKQKQEEDDEWETYDYAVLEGVKEEKEVREKSRGPGFSAEDAIMLD